MSVPSSPVNHLKVHRTVTDPVLGGLALPEKTPPKYDDVVKSGQVY